MACFSFLSFFLLFLSFRSNWHYYISSSVQSPQTTTKKIKYKINLNGISCKCWPLCSLYPLCMMLMFLGNWKERMRLKRNNNHNALKDTEETNSAVRCSCKCGVYTKEGCTYDRSVLQVWGGCSHDGGPCLALFLWASLAAGGGVWESPGPGARRLCLCFSDPCFVPV